jgi:hypothetical protein
MLPLPSVRAVGQHVCHSHFRRTGSGDRWTIGSRENILPDALAARVAPTLLAFSPPLSSSTRVTQPAFDDPAPPWLLGRWRLLRSDPSLDFGPGVRMEFRVGGHLRYTLAVDGRELVVPLVYRTTGDLLETDNPAASHVMSTRFTRGAGDMLILDFAGAQAIFIRER